MLPPEYNDEICKYITGIVQGKGHTMLRIYNVPDHVHMLVGFKPTDISEFIKVVKTTSNKFINEQPWMKFPFKWMEGYGCFSVGSRQRDKNYVCKYIDNQQEHHKKISFQTEYRYLLKKYGVEFKEKYF